MLAQARTAADKSALRVAMTDYVTAVSLSQTEPDLRVILDPFEVGEQRRAGFLTGVFGMERTWVHDDLYTKQEHDRILAAAGSRTIHIRIIDTNYQLSPKADAVGYRADLSKDFTKDEEAPRTRDHSTLCWNNLFGPEGLLREAAEAGRVTFSLIKGLRYAGYGFGSEIDAAVKYVTDNPSGADLDIISMSFGGGGTGANYSQVFNPAVNSRKPIVFIAAAGNSGGTGSPSTVGAPAKVDSCLAVGAYRQGRARAGFSSAGPELDVSGPGQTTPSRDINNTRINWSGTSSSCPNVAGVLALLALENHDINDHHTAVAFLKAYALDLGEPEEDVLYGAGAVPVVGYLDESPDGGDDDDGGDEPGDGDDGGDTPTPDPELPERVVNQYAEGPFIMRWMTESQQRAGGANPTGWTIVTIDDIMAQAVGRYSSSQLAQFIKDGISGYFHKHTIAMVVPDGDGAGEVVEYVARFLYFWTRDHSAAKVPVRTHSLSGTDEYGLTYTYYPDDERLGGAQGEIALPAGVTITVTEK